MKEKASPGGTMTPLKRADATAMLVARPAEELRKNETPSLINSRMPKVAALAAEISGSMAFRGSVTVR